VRRSRLYSIILSFITLGLIISLGYYVYLNADKYLQLLHLSVLNVALLCLLCLTFPVLNGMQNTYLYRNLGADISHQQSILLTSVSTLANQLPISGGLVSKAVYLRRVHDLSYTRFIGSTVALFICFVAVNGLIGLGVLLYWILSKGISVSPLLLLIFAAMGFCFVVFWFPLDRVRLPEKTRAWVARAVEGWTLISTNPRLLLQLVGLQVLLVFLLALRYWLAFHMLSQGVSLSQTTLFASASILTQLVSLAPGGLGVREAIVGVLAATVGFDAATSVVAVGLDRLVMTVIVVLTGGISMWMLGKEFRDAEPGTDGEH
jgi:uncharacterized membrane protein YbhN (UPF0104 family)